MHSDSRRFCPRRAWPPAARPNPDRRRPRDRQRPTVRELGTKADAAADDIRVDGRRVKGVERHRYILLNKPRGYVTHAVGSAAAADGDRPDGGVREYVYPVGRLDYDTEGLLLLTNDGDLAATLTHPRHEVRAGLRGARRRRAGRAALRSPARRHAAGRTPHGAGGGPRCTVAARRTRRRRVRADAFARDATARCAGCARPSVTRSVHLTRTRIGPLTDARLATGQWRDLTDAEVTKLRALRSSGGSSAARPLAVRLVRAAAPPRGASAR